MCAAVALQQPGQQGQQQREGQKVQQEAQEDHSDHAGLGRRLLADGWVRSAAPTSSPAHDGGAPILPGPWERGDGSAQPLWLRQPRRLTLPRGKLSPPAPVRPPTP